MSYVYNTVDLTNVKAGDRVLFRDGSIHTVGMNDRTPTFPVCISGVWYRANGVSNLDSFDSSNNQNHRDVIWIIPAWDAHAPINLKGYKLVVGQYLIAQDEVYQIVDVDASQIPVYVTKLGDATSCQTWYYNSGQPMNISDFKPIQHVCAPLKMPTIERIDLSLAEVGDQVRLRNGEIRKITKGDTSNCPVYAGFWYRKDGVRMIDEARAHQDHHNPEDIVELIKKPEKIKRIDITDAQPGDQVRLRNGKIVTVYENDGLTVPVRAGRLWYRLNGVSNIDTPMLENPQDIIELIKKPKEIERPDLTTAKVGDKVKLRNGEVRTVTRFESTSTYEVVEADLLWCYCLNGVLKGFLSTEENSRDIVELIPSTTNPHKDLLLSILTTKSEESEFVVIDAAALHDLVKPIQDPNKVSKAFVDLLDGWQGPDISVRASYLKQLVEL